MNDILLQQLFRLHFQFEQERLSLSDSCDTDYLYDMEKKIDKCVDMIKCLQSAPSFISEHLEEETT